MLRSMNMCYDRKMGDKKYKEKVRLYDEHLCAMMVCYAPDACKKEEKACTMALEKKAKEEEEKEDSSSEDSSSEASSSDNGTTSGSE